MHRIDVEWPSDHCLAMLTYVRHHRYKQMTKKQIKLNGILEFHINFELFLMNRLNIQILMNTMHVVHNIATSCKLEKKNLYKNY